MRAALLKKYTSADEAFAAFAKHGTITKRELKKLAKSLGLAVSSKFRKGFIKKHGKSLRAFKSWMKADATISKEETGKHEPTDAAKKQADNVPLPPEVPQVYAFLWTLTSCSSNARYFHSIWFDSFALRS